MPDWFSRRPSPQAEDLWPCSESISEPEQTRQQKNYKHLGVFCSSICTTRLASFCPCDGQLLPARIMQKETRSVALHFRQGNGSPGQNMAIFWSLHALGNRLANGRPANGQTLPGIWSDSALRVETDIRIFIPLENSCDPMRYSRRAVMSGLQHRSGHRARNAQNARMQTSIRASSTRISVESDEGGVKGARALQAPRRWRE